MDIDMLVLAAVGVGNVDPNADDPLERVGVGRADVEAPFVREFVAVVGRVACAAGPRAADSGVAGKGTETGLTPLIVPVVELAGATMMPLTICFVAVFGVIADAGPGTGGTGTNGGGKGL
jgi:hypothetical protein